MNMFQLVDLGSSAAPLQLADQPSLPELYWNLLNQLLGPFAAPFILAQVALILWAFLREPVSHDDDDRGGYKPGGDGGGGTSAKDLDDVARPDTDTKDITPEPEPEPEPEPPVIENTVTGESWEVGDDLGARVERDPYEGRVDRPSFEIDSDDSREVSASDDPPSFDDLRDQDDG
jgi:hypothetical protein